MKFNQDIYHLCMAYIGAIIMTVALSLELFYDTNIYSMVMGFSICGWYLIYYFKDLGETIKEDEKEIVVFKQ